MADDQPVRTCSRCGHIHIGVPIQPVREALHFCTRCGTFTLAKELGEMVDQDDRADPDSWGGVGWV